jgi:hypothetical protein
MSAIDRVVCALWFWRRSFRPDLIGVGWGTTNQHPRPGIREEPGREPPLADVCVISIHAPIVVTVQTYGTAPIPLASAQQLKPLSVRRSRRSTNKASYRRPFVSRPSNRPSLSTNYAPYPAQSLWQNLPRSASFRNPLPDNRGSFGPDLCNRKRSASWTPASSMTVLVRICR